MKSTFQHSFVLNFWHNLPRNRISRTPQIKSLRLIMISTSAPGWGSMALKPSHPGLWFMILKEALAPWRKSTPCTKLKIKQPLQRLFGEISLPVLNSFWINHGALGMAPLWFNGRLQFHRASTNEALKKAWYPHSSILNLWGIGRTLIEYFSIQNPLFNWANMSSTLALCPLRVGTPEKSYSRI